MEHAARNLLLRLIAPVLALGSATAQCTNPWLSGGPLPGVGGTVLAATSWDPDGSGPAPSVVVAGGQFVAAGGVIANNIAVHDLATNTWSALGSGVNGAVRALAVLPNGDLVVGGDFTTAGGVPARCLARWNGASWSSVGLAIDPPSPAVRAIAVASNGDLFVSGSFRVGNRNANIARWDGAVWSLLGGANGMVTSLAATSNGDLYAAGQFTTIGSVPAQRIARWDGVAWTPVGSGLVGLAGEPMLAAMPNGDVVASGISGAGSVFSSVVRWDGTAWSSVGGGIPSIFGSQMKSALVRPNGDLLIGGAFFRLPGAPMGSLARWDGNAWTLLAPEFAQPLLVSALASMPNGDVVVGGDADLFAAAELPGSGILRWDGAMAHVLGSGTSGRARSAVVLPNGDIVVAGVFATIEGVPVHNIARWNGAAWSPLGGGVHPWSVLVARPGGELLAGATDLSPFLPPPAVPLVRWDGATWLTLGSGWDGQVSSMLTTTNGDVLVNGTFTTVNGIAVNHVVRWNGSTLTPLGAGLPDVADILFERGDGSIVATVRAASGPARTVLQWDGVAWSSLGSFDAWVGAFDESPAGELIAGGALTANTLAPQPLARIARWNGSAWTTLGAGVWGGAGPNVRGLHRLRNGDLLVTGEFAFAGNVFANGIAIWNGTAWSSLAAGTNGSVSHLVELPDGDLLVAGTFTMAGGQPAARLARWNGSTWSAPVAGIDGPVRQLVARPNGDVFAIGDFAVAGGAVSAFHGTLSTSCPATASVSGSGCTGAAGPVVLAATQLPWLGGEFRAVTTGLPAASLALSVYGFAPASTPLASLLPQGLPGCTLLVAPSVLELRLPNAGSVSTGFFVPGTASLLGAVLHHQVVPLELDASGAITGVTSSNALVLTLGSF